MTNTRRSFLKSGAALGVGALGFGDGAAAAPRSAPATRRVAGESLSILVLGGTAFLGPHVVEAARARGHRITLFNRGRTNPGLFPDLETLHGDRDPEQGDGLTALDGRSWDAVVDTSAYVPRIAGASAELLATEVPFYLFVSTLSVYADRSGPLDEESAVGRLEDESTETVDGETYGPLKALCEEAVREHYPDSCAIVRPGLIVGPRDGSDRFTYWPARVQRGGEVLAPGDGTDRVQFIDVRDLARFLVRLVEERHAGTLNAIGPLSECSMAELLYGCKAVTGGDARFTWVETSFLQEHGVRPWRDMPVWVGELATAAASHARAVEAGLSFRPLAETVRDTLHWHLARPEARRQRLRAGLDPEREAEVLAAWHAR